MEGWSNSTHSDLSAACFLLGIHDFSVINDQRIPARPLAHSPADALGEFRARI